ncbi:hypothetical protein Q1695_014452 [Nippostrongylus brasiliensis]|nr:hypothetical protein Q1695_014452 [Nippostrongylus brasiliensis]
MEPKRDQPYFEGYDRQRPFDGYDYQRKPPDPVQGYFNRPDDVEKRYPPLAPTPMADRTGLDGQNMLFTGGTPLRSASLQPQEPPGPSKPGSGEVGTDRTQPEGVGAPEAKRVEAAPETKPPEPKPEEIAQQTVDETKMKPDDVAATAHTIAKYQKGDICPQTPGSVVVKKPPDTLPTRPYFPYWTARRYVTSSVDTTVSPSGKRIGSKSVTTERSFWQPSGTDRTGTRSSKGLQAPMPTGSTPPPERRLADLDRQTADPRQPAQNVYDLRRQLERMRANEISSGMQDLLNDSRQNHDRKTALPLMFRRTQTPPTTNPVAFPSLKASIDENKRSFVVQPCVKNFLISHF